MAEFTWIPNQGASMRPKFAVNKAVFGDGYSQRVADGINNVKQVWDLSFTLRPRADIDAIDTFLSTHEGVSSFEWETPKGETLRFICETYATSYNHDGDCSATATFEQVFET
jgi:phage-related protein